MGEEGQMLGHLCALVLTRRRATTFLEVEHADDMQPAIALDIHSRRRLRSVDNGLASIAIDRQWLDAVSGLMLFL